MTILLVVFALPIGQLFAQSSTNQKTVLITGAASGIGKATAMAFVEKGYITYATDKDTTKMKKLEELGCRVRYIDVTIDSIMTNRIKALINTLQLSLDKLKM